MEHIRTVSHYDAPIEAVFDVAVDVTLMPQLMASVKDVSAPTGSPEEPGTTYRFHSTFLGRTTAGTVEVLEAQRPTRFRTLTTYASGPRMTWTQSMTPAGDGTDEVDEVDLELPSGVVWALARPLVRRQLQRAMRDSVAPFTRLARARAAGL
jgi:hypothetical protein